MGLRLRAWGEGLRQELVMMDLEEGAGVEPVSAEEELELG